MHAWEGTDGRAQRTYWALGRVANVTTIVELEVFTAVVMKSNIVWDITPCIPLKVNRSFGGTYRLHFQGRRISRITYQRESRWQAEQSASRNGLHGILSPNIVLFIITWTHEPPRIPCNKSPWREKRKLRVVKNRVLRRAETKQGEAGEIYTIGSFILYINCNLGHQSRRQVVTAET
jgi:hypothetical protein